MKILYQRMQKQVDSDAHYDAYINSMVAYETTGPDGRTYRHIDEDKKVQVQMKLVDAIHKKWRKLI